MPKCLNLFNRFMTFFNNDYVSQQDKGMTCRLHKDKCLKKIIIKLQKRRMRSAAVSKVVAKKRYPVNT